MCWRLFMAIFLDRMTCRVAISYHHGQLSFNSCAMSFHCHESVSSYHFTSLLVHESIMMLFFFIFGSVGTLGNDSCCECFWLAVMQCFSVTVNMSQSTNYSSKYSSITLLLLYRLLPYQMLHRWDSLALYRPASLERFSVKIWRFFCCISSILTTVYA